MIIGAHSIIYSVDPEADRAFLRDVLGLPNVDVGEGWLIFGLPPAEVAVHPSGENDVHEFYLMCEDVQALVATMAGRGIECAPVQNQGWGILTHLPLPGGGRLGVYQPRHARPEPMGARATTERGSTTRSATKRRTVARGTRRTKAARRPTRRKAARAGKRPGGRASKRKASRR